ncbi:hypothetical protein BZA70DRAFT_313216 [Myxozyma melibiosi]|uniref:Uncharacterized protein n=1 Tax=Myxozyma melibiosi TaxID=54550 RepID=A0ABR1F034_9ASCO
MPAVRTMLMLRARYKPPLYSASALSRPQYSPPSLRSVKDGQSGSAVAFYARAPRKPGVRKYLPYNPRNKRKYVPKKGMFIQPLLTIDKPPSYTYHLLPSRYYKPAQYKGPNPDAVDSVPNFGLSPQILEAMSGKGWRAQKLDFYSRNIRWKYINDLKKKVVVHDPGSGSKYLDTEELQETIPDHQPEYLRRRKRSVFLRELPSDYDAFSAIPHPKDQPPGYGVNEYDLGLLVYFNPHTVTLTPKHSRLPRDPPPRTPGFPVRRVNFFRLLGPQAVYYGLEGTRFTYPEEEMERNIRRMNAVLQLTPGARTTPHPHSRGGKILKEESKLPEPNPNNFVSISRNEFKHVMIVHHRLKRLDRAARKAQAKAESGDSDEDGPGRKVSKWLGNEDKAVTPLYLKMAPKLNLDIPPSIKSKLDENAEKEETIKAEQDAKKATLPLLHRSNPFVFSLTVPIRETPPPEELIKAVAEDGGSAVTFPASTPNKKPMSLDDLFTLGAEQAAKAPRGPRTMLDTGLVGRQYEEFLAQAEATVLVPPRDLTIGKVRRNALPSGKVADTEPEPEFELIPNSKQSEPTNRRSRRAKRREQLKHSASAGSSSTKEQSAPTNRQSASSNKQPASTDKQSVPINKQHQNRQPRPTNQLAADGTTKHGDRSKNFLGILLPDSKKPRPFTNALLSTFLEPDEPSTPQKRRFSSTAARTAYNSGLTERQRPTLSSAGSGLGVGKRSYSTGSVEPLPAPDLDIESLLTDTVIEIKPKKKPRPRKKKERRNWDTSVAQGSVPGFAEAPNELKRWKMKALKLQPGYIKTRPKRRRDFRKWGYFYVYYKPQATSFLDSFFDPRGPRRVVRIPPPPSTMLQNLVGERLPAGDTKQRASDRFNASDLRTLPERKQVSPGFSALGSSAKDVEQPWSDSSALGSHSKYAGKRSSVSEYSKKPGGDEFVDEYIDGFVQTLKPTERVGKVQVFPYDPDKVRPPYSIPPPVEEKYTTAKQIPGFYPVPGFGGGFDRKKHRRVLSTYRVFYQARPKVPAGSPGYLPFRDLMVDPAKPPIPVKPAFIEGAYRSEKEVRSVFGEKGVRAMHKANPFKPKQHRKARGKKSASAG